MTCDRTWGVFNVQLMEFIQRQAYSPQERAAVLDQIQIDDGHWSWFGKSLYYHTAEYVWFFLMAEGAPQGACLLFHPKKSALHSGKIFYIEYVAVAPWNRLNPMSRRKFAGVGSKLIRCAATYAIHTLKLHPGFSLHALPKAIKYYEDVGMVAHPAFDKDGLPYFEMPETSLAKFIGAK